MEILHLAEHTAMISGKAIWREHANEINTLAATFDVPRTLDVANAQNGLTFFITETPVPIVFLSLYCKIIRIRGL